MYLSRAPAEQVRTSQSSSKQWAELDWQCESDITTEIVEDGGYLQLSSEIYYNTYIITHLLQRYDFSDIPNKRAAAC
jgi:hypothetical protein